MATIWKSTNQKSTNQELDSTVSGKMLSSWSRQQKLAMIAGFAILGLFLFVSACSKHSSKSALVGVSSPVSTQATPTVAPAPALVATAIVPPAPAQKVSKKRPTNVTYSDANSGISFLYPRKFALTSGDKTQPQFADGDGVPMNFIQPGGVMVATVAQPESSYPGTDFVSAFFAVNLNRNISEQQCDHFAVVDSSNPDGEPVDAEKVRIGANDMKTNSNFSATAIEQVETQYYHNYNNGACYEYVLGLSTEGFAAQGRVEHVNRDEVFGKLQKILASVTVKTNPAEHEDVAEQAGAGIAAGKE
jgi:hypothetical protein